MHPTSLSLSVYQPGHSDTFLQLLEGPVMAVSVGSGRRMVMYNLPVALLYYHSQLFRQESLRYEANRAHLGCNKKRKISTEGEATTIEVKKEDTEDEAETSKVEEVVPKEDEAVIKLADVDPSIFGLFLKYLYTGYYPAIVDAQPETKRSIPHISMSSQHDAPCTPAKAAMPPPATINFRQAPPGDHVPTLVVFPSATRSSAVPTLKDNDGHHAVPPSVHAYILSIRLGAPGFLNQALNHIYYGIGKYFPLTPHLVHYIWNHTPPHPFCSSSPLRKLVRDVLVIHWPSKSTHIIAKHPALNKLWNEVFDTHRDLRHDFTMGLQGTAEVLPVQAYFVTSVVPNASARKGAKEPEIEAVETTSTGVGTSAAGAAAEAAAKDQGNGGGEGKD